MGLLSLDCWLALTIIQGSGKPDQCSVWHGRQSKFGSTESGSTEEFQIALLELLKQHEQAVASLRDVHLALLKFQIEQGVTSPDNLSAQVQSAIRLGSMLKLARVMQLRVRNAPNEAALSRVDLDIISITISLPSPSKINGLYDIFGNPIPATTVDGYFGGVVDTLRAVEFIYSLYALINSRKSVAIKDFVRFVNGHPDRKTISNPLLHRFLATAYVEPLRLVSVYYGSPASFDFLGVGKVLEILRDTIKDLLWRGKHEKQTAELERRSKELEIERMKLEAEKTMVEIASRKLEIIEKATKLRLPDKDKKVIISALLPKMATVAASSVNTVLIGKDVMPLIIRDGTPSLDEEKD